MLNMKKRGISPIIATLILIAFVVVIIGIVTLWGRGVYEERAEKSGELANAQLDCVNAAIDVEKVDNQIIITNVGGVTLNGFILRENLQDGNVRLSDIFVDVEVGEEFPLSKSGVGCDPTTEPPAEPSSPGSLCANAKTIRIVPSLQPSGRNAPLVSCADKSLEIQV